MNTTPLCQSTRTRSAKSALLWPLTLAGVMLFLCIGVGLQLPPTQTNSGKSFPMPPGQLQADARTVGAALRYLLEPERDVEMHPAIFSAGAAAVAIRLPDRPCELLACSSNLTEVQCEPSTNRPSRS